jgi:hypothetical protein
VRRGAAAESETARLNVPEEDRKTGVDDRKGRIGPGRDTQSAARDTGGI